MSPVLPAYPFMRAAQSISLPPVYNTLPRVVQVPSPNYSAVPIQHDLLILHMMEGGYAGSVAWLCNPQAKASAHLCMSEDGSEVSQLVPLSMKAWAQCAFNGRGVSLEMPGFTRLGIPTARWRAAAVIFGWLAVAYNIPAVWAKGGLGRGLCQHHDLGAAGGGHVDCSDIGSMEWYNFVGYVAEAREEFAKGQLPPFALHGLPGPHEIVAPPAVTPHPSHGGASRVETVSATPPVDPAGLAAWIQSALNARGYHLFVDGQIGTASLGAMGDFLARHP